jgi:hypothetical protein
MPLSSGNLTALQAVEKPQLAEVLKVFWNGEADSTQIRYYAVSNWAELGNFNSIPFAPIEARLITAKLADGTPSAHTYELNADINSETMQFVFADTDHDIKTRFQTYKSSIRCELYYYFPQIAATSLQWFGHLEKPQIYGLAKQTVIAQNGFRSREFLIPSEIRTKECTARVFSGKLATQDDIDRSICPYNKHLGGAVGVNDPVTSAPYTFCPQLTKTDCSDRLGTDIYFGGFDFASSAVQTDPRGAASRSKGNDSFLRQPSRIVWGKKITLDAPILLFRPELDSNNANRGFIAMIVEASNDEVETIFNPIVNQGVTAVQAYNVRLGTRGQAPTSYGGGVSNFSGRAHLFIRAFTAVNPGTLNSASVKAGYYCHGYKNGRIYSTPSVYTKALTQSRVWAILESYTNNRWGLGYRHDRFDLQSFIDAAAWTDQNIRFTLAQENGTTKTWDIQPRTQFDAFLEGRPAAEFLTDIARAGRISVPFQYDGKYTIVPLAKATSGELSAAPVFTDVGPTRNILFDAEDASALKISEMDFKDLPNTVVVSFEDAENNDISRPVTCKDPNAAAAVGKMLGSGGFKEEKRSVTGYGIRRLGEAVKFGYSVLWFGEFDRGGLKNNLSAEFATTLRQAINLKTYQVIKIVSSKLNGFLSPEGNAFQYFRVQKMRVNSDLSVTVKAQAYNEAAYAAFETVLVGGEPAPSEPAPPADPVPSPIPCTLTPVATAAGDGYIIVEVPNC